LTPRAVPSDPRPTAAMDIKDIMGIKGDAKGAAKKTKGVSEKKPEGVSREVWQITKGQSGDALAPA